MLRTTVTHEDKFKKDPSDVNKNITRTSNNLLLLRFSLFLPQCSFPDGPMYTMRISNK
jgi:hypothetical protein